MKREPNRKCAKCSSCAFFHIDEEGREACRNAGYYFDNKLPEAEACFDFLMMEQWRSIKAISSDRAKSEKWKAAITENCQQWRESHTCKNCAFFPLNENINLTDADKRDWMNFYRCKGYVTESGDNQGWKCADILFVSQYRSLHAPSVDNRISIFKRIREEGQ